MKANLTQQGKTMKSRTRTRALSGLALALGVALPLAGCASDGASDNGEVEGTTITIGTIEALVDQFQGWADAYMDEFPERKVEIRSMSGDVAVYTQQLATQRLSGDIPDIFFNVDFLANTLAASNVALDLSDGLAEHKAGLDLDEFLPQFVGQYRPLNDPDAVTALPVSADSTALFYNKTLFDQVGVTEYPSPDWTWDDYFRVAAEIQEKSGGTVFGAMPPLGNGTNSTVFGPVVTAYGGSIYDPETNTSGIGEPEAVDAWESMIKFYGAASGPYTTTPNDPAGAFESGQVAMGITTRGNLTIYRDALKDVEWDVTETPTVNGEHVSGGGSYGLSIGQNSKNQEAAWAFLGWFYSNDGGLAVAQTPEGGSIIPPTYAGLEDGTWKDATVPANIAVFEQTAKDAILQIQLPGDANTVLNNAVQTAVQEVVLEGADPTAAFEKAQQAVNDALQQESSE